jgi:hypothetical protein
VDAGAAEVERPRERKSHSHAAFQYRIQTRSFSEAC